MQNFKKDQQIPLVQVTDPNTGQTYYAPQNVVYDEKNNNGPQYLRNVIVDQATTASYFSGSVSNAISASYATTASYLLGSIASASFATSASYALTSSFATQALSASYAANGGVTQLLAGPNISLSPTNGLGQVTVSATLSGSTIFNTATGSYGSFYDTTTQTNPVANIPRSMSLNSTDISNGVSVSGSTNPFNTYIKTQNAGIYNIQFSAQVDKTDGGSDDIVIWLRKNGIDLTDTATTLTLPTNNSKVVAAWNWFVTSANGDYYQIIWRSADTDLRLLAESISVDHPGIPSVIVTANRVDQFLSNTGSFSGSFTGVFTGSFSGSVTAPGATTQVVFNNGGVLGANSGFVYSGSRIGIGTTTPSSSLHISGASSAALLEIDSPAVNNIIFVTGSGRVGVGTNLPITTLDVSGSGRFTNGLTVTGSLIAPSITGSLLGTASFASTASFVNPLTQSVAITGSLTVNGSNTTTGTTTLGNGTFTKAGFATGDVLIDNNSTDTPGVLFYYANNSNYGIDSWSGSFDVLSGQQIRITNKLNETGGAVKMAMDTTGNVVFTGFVKANAWSAGQVINDIILSNTEVTISTTTIATSTTDTNFLTYSYTPLSSTSYLIIHYHLGDYTFESGTGNDSYFSRIKVDDAEITYANQSTVNGFRTGVLFPLLGRYRNSNTTAKSIVVAARRDSADDSITIANTSASMWLRITEVAR